MLRTCLCVESSSWNDVSLSLINSQELSFLQGLILYGPTSSYLFSVSFPSFQFYQLCFQPSEVPVILLLLFPLSKSILAQPIFLIFSGCISSDVSSEKPPLTTQFSVTTQPLAVILRCVWCYICSQPRWTPLLTYLFVVCETPDGRNFTLFLFTAVFPASKTISGKQQMLNKHPICEQIRE